MTTRFLSLLCLIAGCFGVIAADADAPKPADSPQPRSGSATNDAVRQMLDRLYSQMNGADTTNQLPPPADAPAPPADDAEEAHEEIPPVPDTPEPPMVPPATPPTNAPIVVTPGTPATTPVTPSATTTNTPATGTPGPGGRTVPVRPQLPRPGTPGAPGTPATGVPTLPGTAGPPVLPGGVRPPGAPAFPGLPGTPAAGLTNAAGTTNTVAAGDESFPPGLIKFQEADLSQVLDIYQELTGRTILRPATLPQVKITIRSQTELTRKEAINALDSILSLNQITMLPQGEKFVKAVPTQQAGQEARAFNTTSVEDLPEAGSFVVQIVKLKNTAPSDVAEALQPFAKNPQAILAIDDSGIVILRDNAENVKRMMEVLEQVDVVPVQEFESVVIPIKYALAGDIAQVLSSLTEGGSATTVGSGGAGGAGLGGGSTLGSRATGSLGGLGGFGNTGGNYGGNYGGRNSSVYPRALNAAAPAAAGAGSRSSFQERLRGIVSRAASGGGGSEFTVLGETQIIADERTNSLLIFAAKKDIPTIKDIVEKLDVVLPQVLIEAIIMEVTLDDSFDFGVSWLQRPQQAGDFDFSGVSIGQDTSLVEDPSALTNILSNISGLRYFGKFNDDFDVALRASASDSRVDLLSRPRIQTSHAVEANLFVGETRPFITGTYFGGIGANGSSSQYQQLQIGITLSVLPLVNVDGLVVMDISQRIQNVSGTTPIDGNDVPITADKEARAKVAVRDRETIMLGGFISTDSRDSESGVPFLKDIPLLGFFFKGSSKANARRELVVLIRPTVLPTPKEAAVVANEEKAKLPGIIAAESKYELNEKQRLEQALKEIRDREETEHQKVLRKEGFKN